MAGKKVKGDVESIRTELNELTEAIYALRQYVTIESAATAAASRSGPVRSHAHQPALAANGDGGEITNAGYLKLTGDDDQSLVFQWSSSNIPVAGVLNQDFDSLARLLAAIGHRQRLAILKAILDKPRSAAEMVTDLQLGTTGAAYHHLNVLQAADLVTQEDRGIFAVHPSKVGTLLTIMASTSAITSAETAPVERAAADEGSPKSKSKKKSGD